MERIQLEVKRQTYRLWLAAYVAHEFPVDIVERLESFVGSLEAGSRPDVDIDQLVLDIGRYRKGPGDLSGFIPMDHRVEGSFYIFSATFNSQPDASARYDEIHVGGKSVKKPYIQPHGLFVIHIQYGASGVVARLPEIVLFHEGKYHTIFGRTDVAPPDTDFPPYDEIAELYRQ